MVLDLDRELPRRRDDQASNPAEVQVRVFLESANDKVNDGNTEAQGFALACLCCDNHVYVRLQVYQRLPLDDRRLAEVVGDKGLCKVVADIKLSPAFKGLCPVFGFWKLFRH